MVSPVGARVAPAELLRRVYAPNFTDALKDAPQGLVGRLLAPGSGYGGERLYFEPAALSDDGAFAIRCSPPGGDGLASMCLRRMELGDIQVEYRYRHDMLKEWRAIEEGLRALLTELAGG